ncbi:acyl-CoA thioesterase [Virgibacillus alimentarius]|uniref:Acyl-CoA hydrolase n=1 Tax=Virgibacillus alimentarius TaxID=698769 RepID=A0ABS4S9L8_9BACI|nr:MULTISPECIES: acyl-CoA thioesterase [Virgibacillus]MBP2258203.1 acyl-CoA hydrolase [Virgibacillus alimentarius]HLR69611.1 acyl-CoA thioesterase [Virgibacillus sp.]
MEAKKCIDSLTVKTSHVLPPDTNAHHTLFGGKLMAHIDDVAAIAAVRHARQVVVTASTDSVDFLAPVKEGDSICVEAFVTWTHHTSMEVFVKAVTEDLITGERKVCATAFLTFVALDEQGKPTVVPPILPETEQQKYLHEGASTRAKRRNERKEQSKEMAALFGSDYPWNVK